MGGVFCEDVLAGTGGHRGRALDDSSEGAHDAGAVGFLLHRDLHLIDSTVKSIDLGGVAQCSTPLTGTCLCGDVRRTLLLGIVTLGQGRVDLMRTQRVCTLILEIDVGRGA